MNTYLVFVDWFKSKMVFTCTNHEWVSQSNSKLGESDLTSKCHKESCETITLGSQADSQSTRNTCCLTFCGTRGQRCNQHWKFTCHCLERARSESEPLIRRTSTVQTHTDRLIWLSSWDFSRVFLWGCFFFLQRSCKHLQSRNVGVGINVCWRREEGWGAGGGGAESYYKLFCLVCTQHFPHLCLWLSSALFTQNWWERLTY